MLKKQKEIEKIMDNITEEMENIDLLLNEWKPEEEEEKESTDASLEKTLDFPAGKCIKFAEEAEEEAKEAEEEGIKNTMRYLKQNSDEMYLRDLDGYFVNEGDLDEDDKDLIEEIKQI